MHDGQFSALAATYSVDRANERITPGAFAETIARWRESGKRLPLHWDHHAGADQVIGYIDPESMRETDEGLYVEGRLDLEGSDVAKDAWRAMKNGTMSLSIGYLVTSDRKGSDEVRQLHGIDLYEISIVPHPAKR